MLTAIHPRLSCVMLLAVCSCSSCCSMAATAAQPRLLPRQALCSSSPVASRVCQPSSTGLSSQEAAHHWDRAAQDSWWNHRQVRRWTVHVMVASWHCWDILCTYRQCPAYTANGSVCSYPAAAPASNSTMIKALHRLQYRSAGMPMLKHQLIPMHP